MPDLLNPFEGGAALVPPGAVMPFAGQAAPQGWLICDGGLYSRALYSTLFNVIGTNYGAGDGVTTFRIPNLLGRIPVGAGQGTGLTNRALGSAGGEETHLLIGAEIGVAQHTHSTPWSPGGYIARADAGAQLVLGSGASLSVAYTPNNSGGVNGIGGSGAIDAQQAHNNMPPFQVLNYIIRT